MKGLQIAIIIAQLNLQGGVAGGAGGAAAPPIFWDSCTSRDMTTDPAANFSLRFPTKPPKNYSLAIFLRSIFVYYCDGIHPPHWALD